MARIIIVTTHLLLIIVLFSLLSCFYKEIISNLWCYNLYCTCDLQNCHNLNYGSFVKIYKKKLRYRVCCFEITDFPGGKGLMLSWNPCENMPGGFYHYPKAARHIEIFEERRKEILNLFDRVQPAVECDFPHEETISVVNTT